MRPDPRDIIKSSATVSDNIRALNRAGYSRSEIATLLGKRYQHVRNVLVDDQVRGRGVAPAPQEGVAESGPVFDTLAAAKDLSKSMWLDVGPNGRLDLPLSLRESLGVLSGGRVLVEFSAEGVWTLTTVEQAIKQMQSLFAPYARPGVSLVDELIAERRAEAERESRDD